MRRKLAAGNWKMNGLGADLDELRQLAATPAPDATDILICPPATLLTRAAKAAGDSGIATGGQDCHANSSGAHTGDISAAMLADCGATYVILGHSERRENHGESDEVVRAKVTAARHAGLTPIICVGESLAEREAEKTLDIIGGQLAGSIPDDADAALVVAYEPIWAIGTGKVPTIAQITEVHDFIRARLTDRFGEASGQAIRLLYGGSVKPANASEIFAVKNVDGALVGGASLKAADFRQIIDALGAA